MDKQLSFKGGTIICLTKQKFIRLLILITLLTTTSGCRVIFMHEEAHQEQEIIVSETIEIDTKILVQRKSVIIRGKSNLNEGAINSNLEII
ncbi:MAG: hypothetical protein ACQEWI_01100 [Bacillota bacterium]